MKIDPKTGQKLFDLLKEPLGLTDDTKRFVLEWEIHSVPLLTVERIIKRLEGDSDKEPS